MINTSKNKSANQVFLSFRIDKNEKEKFKLLASIKGKSGVDLLLDYIDTELKKPLSAKQIRRLPKELQDKIWIEQSKNFKDIYNTNQELNELLETFEEIE